jgi:hypothetical protein
MTEGSAPTAWQSGQHPAVTADLAPFVVGLPPKPGGRAAAGAHGPAGDGWTTPEVEVTAEGFVLQLELVRRAQTASAWSPSTARRRVASSCRGHDRARRFDRRSPLAHSVGVAMTDAVHVYFEGTRCRRAGP